MPPSTKTRILEAAEEIMLAKSFHSVGLNEILAAVKVPKGSFYHYFESKEQFGVELLRHYVDEHTARLRKVLLESQELDPLERIVAYFNGAVSRMIEGECKQFCLVGKLGAEVSTFSEPMRTVLVEGMRAWHGIYEELVREGRAKKVMRKDLKPAAAAGVIQDMWQGAMQRSNLERSVAPAREAAHFLRGYLASA
ncbi:MAG TPA: TetR family transcriptional regulator C-terminal domain-containing protein [Chthoniobacteraceae bacterium]|jgi:TetR/AcrR family transcriptional repressor of nem operon